jgi:Restriction endonuclease
MSQESDDYEAFMAELIKGVKATGRSISEIHFGKGNFLKGASGQQHQIDVSFIDSTFDEKKLVLIECKRWKDPVDVSVPKILKYNLDDLSASDEFPDANLGIIITTSKFQVGAKTIATYEGILIQVVNHGPPYDFRYENIVQCGLQETISIGDSVSIEVAKESST